MKLKSIIALVSILLLGMALGSLATGYVIKQRVDEKFGKMRHPERFENHLLDIIQADETATNKIKPIIKSFHAQRDSIKKKYAAERLERVQAFETQLAPHLDRGAQERLSPFMEHMKRLAKGERLGKRKRKKGFSKRNPK